MCHVLLNAQLLNHVMKEADEFLTLAICAIWILAENVLFENNKQICFLKINTDGACIIIFFCFYNQLMDGCNKSACPAWPKPF